MARKSTSTLPDEDFDAVAEPRASSRSYDDSPLDARILDLDDEEESPFLRGQKRVPVRRGALPRKAAGRIKLLMLALLVVGVFGLVAVTLYRYGTQSWRFRVDSSDNIEILGTRNVIALSGARRPRCRHRSQHLPHFARRPEEAARRHSLDRVGHGHAPAAQPPARRSASSASRSPSSRSTDASRSSILTASSWTCLRARKARFRFPWSSA